MVSQEVRIVGEGLASLENRYTLKVGEASVSRKTLRHWKDEEIRFRVHQDPGSWAVVLQPRDAGPAPITVGTLTVLKYHLPPPGVGYVEGRIAVRLAGSARVEDIARAGDRFERVFVDALPSERLSRWYKVAVPAGAELDRVRAYAALDGVELAEYVGKGKGDRAPVDPYYQSGQQWNVRKARLTAAWEVQTIGSPIAIVDSGIRTTHEEFSGIPFFSRDLTGSGFTPCDTHGTNVASVAAARANNERGFAGAGWLIFGVGNYKVFEPPDCGVTSTAAAQGVDFAWRDGFWIINMSFSFGTDYPQVLRDAVNGAWDHGAFLVSSAGNTDNDIPRYPAAGPNVLAVAASTQDDTRFSGVFGSSYGTWVDLAAPGEGIQLACFFGDGCYELTASGTSIAAPLVAGAAAILHYSGRTNSDIEALLKNNADPVNFGSTPIGGGRLNAYRARVSSQGCIRDIPKGAWVRADDTSVYQVDSLGQLRYVQDVSVLTSWRVTPDLVHICTERLNELPSGVRPWGYRPGSLVRDPGSGAIYLITTDGADRGLPNKRHVTSSTVISCYGWNTANIIQGAGNVLAEHADGAPILTCTSGASAAPAPRAPQQRVFPNGAILRSNVGSLYVLEGGLKRSVPSTAVFDSWFGTEWISATELELSLIAQGADWGFRPGRIVQPAGSAELYFITDDGLLRARGSRRFFPTFTSFTERGYGSVPITSNVGSAILDLHPAGAVLQDANDIP